MDGSTPWKRLNEGAGGHQRLTVAPGDLFRVIQAHFRPDDFVTLNKGATALIVSCEDDRGIAQAIVTDAKGSRSLDVSVLQISEGEFWERCVNAEV